MSMFESKRVKILEDIVENLLRTVNAHSVKLYKKELPLMTDPIMYTDITGDIGSYHRVGELIKFTATYPPSGINIETDTLTADGVIKTAKVIGWKNKAQISNSIFEDVKLYPRTDMTKKERLVWYIGELIKDLGEL